MADEQPKRDQPPTTDTTPVAPTLAPSDTPTVHKKKPWHAPQFICTDVASTDTQGSGGSDGGPSGSPS